MKIKRDQKEKQLQTGGKYNECSEYFKETWHREDI